MKEAGVTSLRAKLKWTEEGEKAFISIKQSLQQAPALALPDYDKPFFLYVSNCVHHATGILTQSSSGGRKQPIAYYSCGLTPVEAALPPCYQGLASMHHMYEKASTLTMGYPITIYTHHKIAGLVERGTVLLTESRVRSYVTLLRYPDVSIKSCTTVNPADNIPLPEEGTPHDCEAETSEYVKLRADLASEPLDRPELTLFVDGSCFREADGLKAGYAVVELAAHGAFATLKADVCQQPCSAQKAELIALTEACQLAKDKTVNIYTDSSYAHGVFHLFGSLWRSRGFRKTDGSPIQHHGQVMSLIIAMMLPDRLAIIKCKAHQNDLSTTTMGNNRAEIGRASCRERV